MSNKRVMTMQYDIDELFVCWGPPCLLTFFAHVRTQCQLFEDHDHMFNASTLHIF